MRIAAFALALALGSIVGCAASSDNTNNTADSSDTEVRVGAKKSISGLRLGKYDDTAAQEGEFRTLTLESRTSRTSKDYDGVWSGTVKKGSSTLKMSGGFTVVKKKIPMESQASGFLTTFVVKLFSKADNNALYREVSYTNVQNSVALYDWKTKTEQILNLVSDSQGKKPFDLSCTLTKLHDDNVFEEGLSLEEYPDISIEEVDGKLEVGIGAASYDGTDGDKLVEKSRSGSDIDITITLDNQPAYRIAVKAKKGVIESFEDGKTNKVADFTCR